MRVGMINKLAFEVIIRTCFNFDGNLIVD